ncbi:MULTISPECIES: hypothetical protein, partial [Ruminococcus]|uniref:hypothetical protein n=1 Tax=Ruminococcus TaxID=1263 RepID=UPI001A9A5074
LLYHIFARLAIVRCCLKCLLKKFAYALCIGLINIFYRRSATKSSFYFSQPAEIQNYRKKNQEKS